MKTSKREREREKAPEGEYRSNMYGDWLHSVTDTARVLTRSWSVSSDMKRVEKCNG